MVFIELSLSHSTLEINKDFRLFLSTLFPREREIVPGIKMVLDKKIIGISSYQGNVSLEAVNVFKTESGKILNNFKGYIKGKYSSKSIRSLKFTTNLYSPIKEMGVFCIKGKTAVAVFPIIEKLPFKSASEGQKIYIKSSSSLKQVVSVLKDFIFYNAKKTAGIDVSQDIQEV